MDLIVGLEDKILIADKGYDANYIVEAFGAGRAVIPSRAGRKIVRFYDTALYEERNLIERMFNKLKHFRRVATRYDKLAIAYLSFVYIAATHIWLR